METILICAVAVLVIAVIILARCVYNVNANSKFSINGLAKRIDERDLWAKALEKEFGIESLMKYYLEEAYYCLMNGKGGKSLSDKISALEEKSDDQASMIKGLEKYLGVTRLEDTISLLMWGGKRSAPGYYYSSKKPAKLDLLLDHLKLEIINEPEKTVVRRKK